MEIRERDKEVMQEVYRWRYMFGRHISQFCFPSESTSSRRVRKLVEAGYLKKQYVLYGYPPLYTLSHKGRILLGVNKRADKVNASLIPHTIAVLDTAVYFHKRVGVSLEAITTEKELHIKDGFSERRHHPDFTYQTPEGECAVEVELTLKSEQKLHENIKSNFIEYEKQIWVVEKRGTKIEKVIKKETSNYPNITIMYLSDFEFI